MPGPLTAPRDGLLRAIAGWSAGWGIAGLSVGLAMACSNSSVLAAKIIFVAGSACGLAFGAYKNERSYDLDEPRRVTGPVIAWALSTVAAAPLVWNWQWLDRPSVTIYTEHTPALPAYITQFAFAWALVGAFGGVLSTLVAERPWRRPPVDALMVGAGWSLGCAIGACIYVTVAYIMAILTSPLLRLLEGLVGRSVAGGISLFISAGAGGVISGFVAAAIGVSIERFVAVHFATRRGVEPVSGIASERSMRG